MSEKTEVDVDKLLEKYTDEQQDALRDHFVAVKKRDWMDYVALALQVTTTAVIGGMFYRSWRSSKK